MTKRMTIFLVLIVIILVNVFLNSSIYSYKQYTVPLYRYIYMKFVGLNKHYLFKPPLNLVVATDILLTTKEILDSQNIKFWLSEGTALGIYRGDGLMLHDTDVDVEIDYNDDLKLFNSIGLFIEKGLLPWRIETYVISFCKDGEYIDVAICYPGKHCVICDCETDIIPKYELETIIFENKEFLIPEEKYYEFLYGTDWKTPIKNNRPHFSK